MTTTTGTWYPPALGTGGFLHEGQLFANPPFAITPSRMMNFKPGDHVVMRSRLRDDVVTISAISNGRISVNGTTAQFCAVTGLQVRYPNCWGGWCLMPLDMP